MALLALLMGPGQDGEGPTLRLRDQSRISAEVLRIEVDGHAHIRERGRRETQRIPLESISTIRFGREGPLLADRDADRTRLVRGGRITGRILAFDGTTARVEGAAGPLKLPREHVRSFSLGRLEGPLPSWTPEGRDVLVRTGKGGLAVEHGRLESIGEKVAFRTNGEVLTLSRTEVKRIELHHEHPPGPAATGWFAKILFRNGDRLVGALRDLGPERVRLFSPEFGRAAFPPDRLRSITFVRSARIASGSILVCESGGVRELDASGTERWAYPSEPFAASARKLENGNVLIASSSYGRVVEVTPRGSKGGTVRWRAGGLQSPFDAVRLQNGNTLVAEKGAGRVVELAGKANEVAWSRSVNHPLSVERLPGGRTLVAHATGVVEFDREGRETWRSRLAGLRPHRAHRLENGNVLVVEPQRHRVIEIDSDSKIIWERTGLRRPVEALRIENGNVLILEQQGKRIIEVDPARPEGIVREITGLNYASAMSVH